MAYQSFSLEFGTNGTFRINYNAKAYNFFSTLQTHLLYQYCICNRVLTILYHR